MSTLCADALELGSLGMIDAGLSDRVPHTPVMASEVLTLLAPRPGETFVDATAGAGGHSLLLAPQLSPGGRLIVVDQDPEALAQARQRLADLMAVSFERANFRQLADVLARQGIGPVDGLLLDLGVSSMQLDRAERGFSFAREGPLDMRMDPGLALDAGQIVNRWSEPDLAHVIKTYGEERFAGRIARALVRGRPFGTTHELADAITRAVPPAARHGRLHPATRTFQAIRMVVNDELGALEAVLQDLPGLLAPGGRAAIISFHSLEDRLVKQRFLHGRRDGIWDVLTKKPLQPGDDESGRNPRARSAKLRAVRRAGGRA